MAEGRVLADAAPRHLDLGLRHFYAPQSFTAADGRRSQFGWAQEARPEASVQRAGWSGVVSLARELCLRQDGTVAAAPIVRNRIAQDRCR